MNRKADTEKLVSAKIREDTHKALRMMSAEQGRSMVEILDELVEREWNKRDNARR